MISEELKQVIIKAIKGKRKITFLVGAGLSAESGIPVFRGKDGFWTDGSKKLERLKNGYWLQQNSSAALREIRKIIAQHVV